MNQVPAWLLGVVLASAIAAVAFRARALSADGAGGAVITGTVAVTSGGVTAQGLVAGIAGAGFVALVAWMARWPTVALVAALAGGTIGCVLDSVVGASLQARRWCATCASNTEQRIHRCGTRTTVTG